MKNNLIGIEGMAEILNVPKSWLYSRTRTGEVPHYKVGKYVRFDAAQVMEWIKRQNAEEQEGRFE
jgi:excisionase family DNA binding protein